MLKAFSHKGDKLKKHYPLSKPDTQDMFHCDKVEFVLKLRDREWEQ